jgi:hypothetical protein
MIWGTATSLLIHNTGLPIGVLCSFLWVLLGLSLGWIAISLHKDRQRNGGQMHHLALDASKSRRVLDRMFSLKAFHGCVMFVSWINIAGRVFNAPLDADFECYTYPVFKPNSIKFGNTTTTSPPYQLVPRDNPQYSRQPWANGESNWLAMMLLAPLAGAFVVGCVYVWFTVPNPTVSASTGPPNDSNSTEVNSTKVTVHE